MLAGDNAIVVGMVASSLPLANRRRVIIAGIAAATLLRIVFALLTVQLMQIIGLILAGGLLLLWVCWRLWRDIEDRRKSHATNVQTGATLEVKSTRTLRQAVLQIVIADVSMSLDNVLAVAGIARETVWVLVFGLVLSVAFMGLAAAVIARALERHHWIAYVGLAVILYVAISMIVDGSRDISDQLLSYSTVQIEDLGKMRFIHR